ncbi:MAG: monofunctional biosynthetic peptidoglycan transglycosylase [Saprospiraceae bacterium]|nr:monofunctional biosynthetic peptidoglycan transglycosylase [Saprospiraceae bacterium]
MQSPKITTAAVNFIANLLRRIYRGIPKNESGQLLWGRWLRNLAIKAVLLFFGLSIGSTILYMFVPVIVTPLMFQRTWEQMWDSERDLRWKHDWVSFSELSPQLQLAVVCAEDQDFLEHEGFDFEAIEKAYKYNKTHKRKRGASTISQQTAKNVFLLPTRSWIRKGLEVYFTFMIETFWSKERIMTAYLNSIEFGDGIYGAEAAAQHFFGKNAQSLNRNEAALLAAVLPNPLIYKAEKPTSHIRERQQWIMSQMRMWGGKIDFEDPNTPKKK